MKSIISKVSIPVSAIIAAFLLFCVLMICIIAGRVGATSDTNSQNGHLVTIHDGGKQTVVSTQAATIGDALKEAHVVIDKSDSVEPAASEKLVASEYQVNIYRARPVIVVDGATKQKVITPYQTAAQIATSAGITLLDSDTTSLSRTDNIVSEGAGLRLTIDRATPFTFVLYGKTTAARTQGATVGDMLKEKGVTMTQDDRLSVDRLTPITAGLSVQVWREGKQTITQEEVVAFTTKQIQDGDQEIGYKLVRTAGINGAANVTYEIMIKDGVEVGRTMIANVTSVLPVTQEEVVGAKYKGAYTTPGQNEVITWNFLLQNGFTREQTAGIMGNLQQEHGFNTTGDGLAQWTGGRKANLLSRPDPYNIYTQLDFLMFELNNGYRSVQASIKAAESVDSAVIIFQNKFEGCGVCMQSQRLQYAYNILASH